MDFISKIRSKNPVSFDKLTVLGKARSHTHVRYGSAEFALIGMSMADPSEYRLGDGEFIVAKQREQRLSDGEPWKTTVYDVATPVVAGSFEKLRAGTQATEEQAPRTWDALAEYRQTSSDVRRIPLRAGNIDVGALKATLGGNGHVPWLERPAGGLDDQSPAGIVAYLRARGITLELGRGRLIARSATPMNIADRQLLDRAEQLIIGELGGSKPLCSECAEPATTIVIPRAPMCAEHAE